LLTLVASLALACGSDGETPPARVIELLSTSETVLEQPIVYFSSTKAEVGSTIVTLQPGEDTGWHHHNAPLYAYILEGTVTVDYGDEGVRTYEAGTAFMEAIGTSHIGRNEADEQVRILVVNFGAEGVENSVADD
jgi:quercetin dioxygenase-like cupin family protein